MGFSPLVEGWNLHEAHLSSMDITEIGPRIARNSLLDLTIFRHWELLVLELKKA